MLVSHLKQRLWLYLPQSTISLCERNFDRWRLFFYRDSVQHNLRISIRRSVPEVFGNEEDYYLDLIKEMLEKSLMDGVDYKVRLQAVRAVSAFIILHEGDVPVQEQFSDLLPKVIQVITESIEKQDYHILMKSLINLAESAPKVLRPHLDNLLKMCMNVFSNEEFPDSWRQFSLEAMIIVAETEPVMLCKVGNKYIPLLVQQILKLMTDLKDVAEWRLSDKILDKDNDRLSWLPVWEDKDESPHVYGYLCDLIEGEHPIILGPNQENVPKLIAIISEAFANDAIAMDSEVANRMVGIDRQIQGNSEVFHVCISKLNAEQQHAIHQVLTEVNGP